jgi:hypothetical protein
VVDANRSPAVDDFRELHKTLTVIVDTYLRTPDRLQDRLDKTHLVRYVGFLRKTLHSTPFDYPADGIGSTCTPALIVKLRRVSLEILLRWDIGNGLTHLDDRPLVIEGDEIQLLQGATKQLAEEIAKAQADRKGAVVASRELVTDQANKSAIKPKNLAELATLIRADKPRSAAVAALLDLLHSRGEITFDESREKVHEAPVDIDAIKAKVKTARNWVLRYELPFKISISKHVISCSRKPQ